MNLIFRKGLTLMTITAASLACVADDIEINHLGPNHTYVRVKGDDKLLILPIQESIDDARINVLVDGKIDRTFRTT